MGRLEYSQEIDGIRAVSVLSVLLFHFGFMWIPGGYIGVDVFFVISGYLITFNIWDSQGGRCLILMDFYVRRIKRLYPALFFISVICMIAGYLILIPGDFEDLSKSLFYTLIAGSNLYFLSHTGYFDASAQAMPLLHTWSLAVEEQFYLIWPFAVWVLRKVWRGNSTHILLSVALLFTLSFCLNIYLVADQGKSGFYRADSRAWELLIGSGLALLHLTYRINLPKFFIEILAISGVAAIIFSAIFLGNDTPYPGCATFLSVLGATAFLLPIGKKTIVYSFISVRFLTLIGRASYSIYLWHWPILVFWKYYNNFEKITDIKKIYLVLFSCIIGFISWALVEQPVRRMRAQKYVTIISFIVAQLMLSLICGWVVLKDGLPSRMPESVNGMRSLEVMWNWQCPHQSEGDVCEAGQPWQKAAHRILLIGDSNAEHFMPLLAAADEGHDVSIRLIHDCSPVVDGVNTLIFDRNDPKYAQKCQRFRAKFLSSAKEEPRVSLLIFASAWSAVALQLVKNENEAVSREAGLKNLEIGMDNLLADVEPQSQKIVIISDIPRWEVDPIPCVLSQQTSLFRNKCAENRERLDWKLFNRDQRNVHDLLRTYGKRYNVTVVSPEDYLCDISGCTTVINSEFIYRDQGHLRRNLKYETMRLLSNVLKFDKIIEIAEGHDLGDR